ncbi:MAG TPA: metallophosphoesterase [Paracoccus sp.]|nr:metallophosphoesterase [Paracoccus sp. (in: a-proteobacteria)]
MEAITVPVNLGRIVIIGDPHYDKFRMAKMDPFEGLEALNWGGIDALIIAGDLADAPQINWLRALDWLGRYVQRGKIFIIPGNHDYYAHALGADEELRLLTASRGARLVQKQELRYGDIRLPCCTLWTDFSLLGDPEAAMLKAATSMLDYDRISRIKPMRSGNHVPISPEDTLALHHDHRAWLEDALAEPHFAGPAGRTVVVTHHGPHPLVAGPLDALSPCFHSDLSALIDSHQPEAWFFGHSHYRLRAQAGATDLRNVAIGYPREPRIEGSQSLVDMCVLEL